MTSSAVDDDNEKEAPGLDVEPHPADEDDDSTGGERTVAQPFSMEIDPSVPMPITVPPPAIEAPKTAGTQRMGQSVPKAPAAPSVATAPVAPPRPVLARPAAGAPSAPRIPLPPPPSTRTPGARPQRQSSPDAAPASARTNVMEASAVPKPPRASRPDTDARASQTTETQSATKPVVRGDKNEPAVRPQGRDKNDPVVPPRPPRASQTNETQTAARPPAPVAAPAAASADVVELEEDDPMDDGPTMATAPGALEGLLAAHAPEEPRRSPLASTGFAPIPPMNPAARPTSMSDAETVARAEDPVEQEQEETTRAVSRDELFRNQDAHVIVGDDAIGDEATLAVAPEQAESLGIGKGMGAALAQSLDRKDGGEPAFPPPPGFGGPAQPPPRPPGAPAPQTQAMPPALAPGMAPPPGAQGWAPPGGAPSSGGFAASQQTGPQTPRSGQLPPSGPMAAHMPGPIPGQPMMGPMNGPAPMHAGGPHAPMPMPQPLQPRPATKITPQIIALVAVGAVCLAIFVVGLYLFFTTKF